MLTIYRASAGAGKTHHLTGDYLKLLFARPNAYRRILAVTFTNKATDEMKNRIIEELFALASDQFSPHIDDLCSHWTLTEKQLRQRAKETLCAILHDYSSFNISTIDRFFQQTMRAFTREIGLQGGYGLEMDKDMVLSEAVDNLLADLDKKENKRLLGWLLRFAESKVEDTKNWNLQKDIKTLGIEVFEESFKLNNDKVSEDIADKDALENYRKILVGVVQSIENEMKRLGERGVQLMRQFGLTPQEFAGKSKSPFFRLEKLAAGEMKELSATFMKLPDNVDEWYAKTAPPALRQRIQEAYNGGLNDCIRAIVGLFSNLTDYQTAKEILRYYYTLGILNDLSAQIAAYREEKNILLIADTTELLSKVIDGSDAPFVYEKTGTRIDHYMIDEFQDTSSMQWHNFRPLIKESLAHRKSNLIVGDVKQSIYRFRNSDWTLLDEKVRDDFHPEQLDEQVLKENWRSARLITSFNNSFFAVAPDLVQREYNQTLTNAALSEEEKAIFSSRITQAYKKNYQIPAPPLQQKEGHVRIEFIAEEKGEQPWEEQALDRLPGVLQQLQDNGYALRDIGILVHRNKEAIAVANKLLTYKDENPSDGYRYDLISDQALLVGSSPSVRFLIAVLTHLRSPEDTTARQMARFSYYALAKMFDPSQEDMLVEKKEALEALSTLSLYEMAEGLCRLFEALFPANEQVFIQAFLDQVTEYSRRETGDLGKFLKWWDENGTKKAIASPEGQDAIRILTIHKAKGLGMKAILIPFGDWLIDDGARNSNILWCTPHVAPFNQLRLVPVRYAKELAKTHFASDYFNECLYVSIDNLNALYVALTRSKEELIIFAPRPKLNKSGEVEKINSIASLLWAGLSSDRGESPEGEVLDPLSTGFDPETGCFEWGSWWKTETKAKTSDTQEILFDRLVSVSPDDRLSLRLQGQELCIDDSPRKRGTLMHEILSGIRTVDDIAETVEQYRREGVINRQEAKELAQELQRLLYKPEVYAWYKAPTRVLNEVEILSDNGKTRRPDRVMLSDGKAIVVDYKFGEMEEPAHHSQVRNYLRLIRRMGYSEVKGYLWYVGKDTIKEVIEE